MTQGLPESKTTNGRGINDNSGFDCQFCSIAKYIISTKLCADSGDYKFIGFQAALYQQGRRLVEFVGSCEAFPTFSDVVYTRGSRFQVTMELEKSGSA